MIRACTLYSTIDHAQQEIKTGFSSFVLFSLATCHQNTPHLFIFQLKTCQLTMSGPLTGPCIGTRKCENVLKIYPICQMDCMIDWRQASFLVDLLIGKVREKSFFFFISKIFSHLLTSWVKNTTLPKINKIHRIPIWTSRLSRPLSVSVNHRVQYSRPRESGLVGLRWDYLYLSLILSFPWT